MSPYFLQGSTTALDDEALAAFIQITVAGITGIPGQLVRPRWQPEPLPQPPQSTNWIAVGVTERIGQDYPYEHVSPTPPYDMDITFTQQRQERLEVLASCYGPNAGATATALRDGLYLGPNRDFLKTMGINVREVGDARTAPEMVAAGYLNKVDVPLSFMRQVDRTYAILSLLGVEIRMHTEERNWRMDVGTPAQGGQAPLPLPPHGATEDFSKRQESSVFFMGGKLSDQHFTPTFPPAVVPSQNFSERRNECLFFVGGELTGVFTPLSNQPAFKPSENFSDPRNAVTFFLDGQLTGAPFNG